MFILNNTHDRPHYRLYRERTDARPIFDLSSEQLSRAVNSDWYDLATGALTCVVSSSRKLSLIYEVTEVSTATSDDAYDPEVVGQHAVWGKPIARMAQERIYTSVLNKYSVDHPRLPKNKFPNGFNVANLGDQLDSAPIKNSHFKHIRELRLNSENHP